VLTALGEGFSYGEVATQFGVSLSTIQSHVRNLYEKLRASSKIEALNNARRHGLLD
jgi:DNA-binding NarL/FixJ family response regulator